MKPVLLVVWMLTVALVSAQVKSREVSKEPIPTIDQMKTELVTTGYSFKLHSEVLHEERTIMVALPDDYGKSAKRYPVFYMVDGQWNFKPTAQAISTLSGNGLIPQMVLVAVHTGDQRDRDLLPTRNEQSKMGGGADTLLRFMKEELIPFVDKNYRTYPFRILAGTSFGGVFVIHAFVTDPDLFNSYLALSPSMWWDYRIMLKRTEDVLSKNPKLHNYLYVAVANEGSGMGVEALANILTHNSPKELVWKYDQYPEEIHGTVSYKGTYNGLKFVFADWSSEPINFETKGDLLSPRDSVVVRCNSYSRTIRYTLDGLVPTSNSAPYEKPIIVTKPVILKAVPYYGLGIPGNCDSLVVHYIPKLNAETNLTALKNGLKYSYYEGDWDALPDYDKLTPITSGIATNLKMDERKKDNLFAMRYTGLLSIPKDNIYCFSLSSDDGSRLVVGDSVIVNNDGVHGDTEKSGKVYLQGGKHRITILFFQKGGGYNLKLNYESAGIPKQEVPGNAFYYVEK